MRFDVEVSLGEPGSEFDGKVHFFVRDEDGNEFKFTIPADRLPLDLRAKVEKKLGAFDIFDLFCLYLLDMEPEMKRRWELENDPTPEVVKLEELDDVEAFFVHIHKNGELLGSFVIPADLIGSGALARIQIGQATPDDIAHLRKVGREYAYRMEFDTAEGGLQQA